MSEDDEKQVVLSPKLNERLKERTVVLFASFTVVGNKTEQQPSRVKTAPPTHEYNPGIHIQYFANFPGCLYISVTSNFYDKNPPVATRLDPTSIALQLCRA